MTLLSATVTPEMGWLSTDSAVCLLSPGVTLPRATTGTAAQAAAELGAHRAERGATAADYGFKFLQLPRQRLVAAAAGSLPLWLALAGVLSTQQYDLDAAAALSPAWLRGLAPLQPGAELTAVLVGWSASRQRVLGWAFASGDNFEPMELSHNHAISPMPSPEVEGYAELAGMSQAAAEGRCVQEFHTALARVQKAGSDRGLYGSSHVAGGWLWLARVTREGVDARPVADLGA